MAERKQRAISAGTTKLKYKKARYVGLARKIEPLEGLYSIEKKGHRPNRKTITNMDVFGQHENILSRENLVEENRKLKQQNNSLVEDLIKDRGKLAAIHKRNSRTNRKYEIQFEKQIYWSGSNNHMIAGVKHQYQLLKESYQNKCQELEELRREEKSVIIEELQVYAGILKAENINLNNKLQMISEKQPTKYQLIQSKGRYENMMQRFRKNRGQNRQMRKRLKLCLRKNKFIQKQIIQKSNREHELISKYSKLERQIEGYRSKIEDMGKQIQDKEEEYKENIKELRKQYETKMENQIKNYSNIIQKQSEELSEAQKNISSLKTIAECWKSNEEYKSQGQDMDIINNYVSNQLKNPKPNIQLEEQSRIPQSGKKSNRIVARSRRTGQIRASQQSIKNRRISKQEIMEDIQYLKYKLIGKNIDFNEIKKLVMQRGKRSKFQKKKVSTIKTQSNMGDNSNLKMDEEWEEECITMKELIEILKQLGLTQQRSYLISRYIIEDTIGQYIYTDKINQNYRNIVQSILYSLLDNYEIISVERQNEYESILKKYTNNILPALIATGKNGVIGIQRFRDTLGCIGSDKIQQVGKYAISRMALHSQCLQKLNFQILFQ